MNRITKTEKWEDDWFQELTETHKLLFLWLCDHCDCAGTIIPNWKLASFQIGKPVAEKDVENWGDHIIRLDAKRFFIRQFIAIQYPKLSRNCRWHDAVFAAIEKYNLTRFISPTIVDGQALKKSSPPATPPQSPKTQEEPAPEKNEKPKPSGNGQIDPKLLRLQHAMAKHFGRAKDERWSCLEEGALAEVAKRPMCVWESKAIRDYLSTIEPQYKPRESKNLADFLANWRKLLDQAVTAGFEVKEEDCQPESEHYRLGSMKWSRTDGGPKREQFNLPKVWDKTETQDKMFQHARREYDKWIASAY